MNRDLHIAESVQRHTNEVQFEGPARPTLFIPDRDTTSWDQPMDGSDDDDGIVVDVGAATPRDWIAPILLYDFQRKDTNYTIWLNTASSVVGVYGGPGRICS